VARTSMTLPDKLLDDLNYLSRRLGISKSALISELLGDNLKDMRVVFETMPEDPSKITAEQLVRFRGASAQVVKDRVKQAKELGMGDDLFS